MSQLKTQMATLLKGHTHLQGEFSVFFDELRPPPARPGQFEEAIWPEDGGNITEGGDRTSLESGGFEEVTLPDLEEEEETPKIPQITGRSRKRKELSTHRNYKVSKLVEHYGALTRTRTYFCSLYSLPKTTHSCIHLFMPSFIRKGKSVIVVSSAGL